MYGSHIEPCPESPKSMFKPKNKMQKEKHNQVRMAYRPAISRTRREGQVDNAAEKAVLSILSILKRCNLLKRALKIHIHIQEKRLITEKGLRLSC